MRNILSYFLPLKLSFFNKHLKECLKNIKGYYKLVFLLLPHRTNSITHLNAICLQPRLWSQTFCLDKLDSLEPRGQGWGEGEPVQERLQTDGWGAQSYGRVWRHDLRVTLSTELCVSVCVKSTLDICESSSSVLIL